MRVLLRGAFNEQSIIESFLNTVFPDPSAREEGDIPNTLDELFSKFFYLDIQSTTLADGTLQLDISPPRNQEYNDFQSRIGQLSMLLDFLKPSISESNQPSHELKIIAYYKDFRVFRQLQNLPNIAPGLEKLKITRRTGTPLKLGEILIPSDITLNAILDFFHRIIDAKKAVGDDIFEKDNLLVEPVQPTISKAPLKKDSNEKIAAQEASEENNDSDSSSISTAPPSPPRTPDSRDDDRTVNLYEEEDSSITTASTDPSSLEQDQTMEQKPQSAILPEQLQPENNPKNMGASEHHKQETGRVSPSATTEVEQLSDVDDDISDTTTELHTVNESMPNDYGRHSRQWYIDNAEAMNQYLQEDDIKLLEYLVDETADHMSMMDSLLWQRVTQALLNIRIVGELPEETVKPYLNAFHEEIKSKRHEYEAINSKKPAKPLMSEEEIKIAIQQDELNMQEELLESMRELLESQEDQRIFDAIVKENQEGLLINEKGWNRLKQIFELKEIDESWEEIRDKLISQHFSESAWQAVDDFFTELEAEKDLALLDEISTMLKDNEVRNQFKKLLDSSKDEHELIRKSAREQIREFCEFVSNNPEKWQIVKTDLLQASTPEAIEEAMNEVLLKDANEKRAKKIKEHPQRIQEIRMENPTRGDDEIITTGLYKLHREELHAILDPVHIDILDKFLTYPTIDPITFKAFWNDTNLLLKTYLAATYKKEGVRNEDEISIAKHQLEEHLSEMHKQYLSECPRYDPSQYINKLEIRPMTYLLLSTYYSMGPAVHLLPSSKDFERKISKILVDGNDESISDTEVNALHQQLNKEVIIAVNAKVQNVLQGLENYIERVSSEKFRSGSDFSFFKDRRAKSRANNCAFAKEIRKQITENPQNLSLILSEENISKVKQKTGAKVTNSTELNNAIKTAQKALNQADSTQQQSRKI